MKKVIKKTIKYFLFTVLALVITVNLFIVLSGRFYIYKGIANTYMVGNIGPSIYDLDVFPYSTIKAPKEKSVVTYSSNFNTYKLTKADRKYIEDLETTAFLVYKGNTLVYEEYWDEHNAKTVSNSFSVAKTVVSMLVGIAVEDGDIKSLDDPIQLYLNPKTLVKSQCATYLPCLQVWIGRKVAKILCQTMRNRIMAKI